jgi:hypothetical protein
MRIAISKIALVAGIISLLVYLPTLTYDFTNLDDPGFVQFNTAIRKIDLDFLKWAFANSEMGWWMPLIWLSFAVDYLCWGLNPAGYHLTNIILHAMDVGLVVVLADLIFREVFGNDVTDATPGYSYSGALLLAGLLFGIHPLHVESVAWVSERKNVLSTLFTLATIISYLRYLRPGQTASQRQKVRSYLVSLSCLILSLMTKPVGVVVPVMLLVADWYPYNRLCRKELRTVVLEKIPFFAVALLAAIISISSASGERVLVPLDLFPLQDRFILSGYAVFEYCRLLLAPVGIVVLYLIPIPLPPSYTLKAAVILAVTLLLLSQIRKRPWLFATWCCFLLPLSPSLHFFINGANRISTHFTYLPAIVPGIAVAASAFACQRRLATSPTSAIRLLVPLLSVSLLLFYLVEHRLYLGSWKNSGTLWTRVIELEPAGRAYYYRGDYYMGIGRYAEAVADFRESVEMAKAAGHPEIYTLYAILGEALLKAERNEEAVTALTQAIIMAPLPSFFYFRSLALRQSGRIQEADEDLARAGNDRGPIVWQYLQNRDDLKPKKVK